MWCPEGYVTFEEIISQLRWDLDQMPLAQGKPLELRAGEMIPDNLEPDEREVEAFIKWSFAALFRLFEKDVRICLPTGNLVRMSPSVLLSVRSGWFAMAPVISAFPARYDDRLAIADWDFPFVDLEWGTLKADAAIAPMAKFAGASLCVSEERLAIALPRITEWLLEEAPKLGSPLSTEEPTWSSSDLVNRIVAAFSSGTVTKKVEAKNMFGKDLPTASWNAVWEQVTQINPALSKPGPRRT